MTIRLVRTSHWQVKADTGRHLAGRLLRLLCNQNVYREITPDVFANTRISEMLDTGKSLKEILER